MIFKDVVKQTPNRESKPHIERGHSMTKLKDIRKSKGMTQAALSAFSGVNRVSIAKYETGKSTPSLKTAERLAVALGVKVDELIGD